MPEVLVMPRLGGLLAWSSIRRAIAMLDNVTFRERYLTASGVEESLVCPDSWGRSSGVESAH